MRRECRDIGTDTDDCTIEQVDFFLPMMRIYEKQADGSEDEHRSGKFVECHTGCRQYDIDGYIPIITECQQEKKCRDHLFTETPSENLIADGGEKHERRPDV